MSAVKPRWRRTGERLGSWWSVTYTVLYLPVSALARTRYGNAAGVPATGPVILAVNHVSHADPLLLAKFVLDIGRVPRFLAKDTLFRGRFAGTAMRGMGHIPVSRDTVDAQHALAPAIASLAAGRVVMMYPEGTVTRDPEGWPMAGRLGTARLALAFPDAPVIPVGQWGVQESIDLYRRKVRLLPRPRHAFLVGPPVELSAFRDAPPTVPTLARMTDLIMDDVRRLVAELRGVPAPTGPFYRWRRPGRAGTAGEAG